MSVNATQIKDGLIVALALGAAYVVYRVGRGAYEFAAEAGDAVSEAYNDSIDFVSDPSQWPMVPDIEALPDVVDPTSPDNFIYSTLTRSGKALGKTLYEILN